LSPESAWEGEGKGWLLAEETVTYCSRTEEICLALGKESWYRVLRKASLWCPRESPRKALDKLLYPRIILLCAMFARSCKDI